MKIVNISNSNISLIPKDYFQTEVYKFGKKAFSEYSFRPYPFSKDFCIACDVYYNDVKLQPDWMEELIFLCRESLKFYKSDQDIKEYISTNEKDKEKEMVYFLRRRESRIEFLNLFLSKFGSISG